MGRGRAQANAAEGITEAVVFSVLLLVALWVLSLIFPGFAATFGFFNSLLFALAYFAARGVRPGQSAGRFPAWLGTSAPAFAHKMASAPFGLELMPSPGPES